MWTYKRLLSVAAVFSGVLILSAEARAEKKIGILIFSDENRYVEAANGFKDRLNEDGYHRPDTVFIERKAGANKARAAEYVKEISAAKVDLIYTLGTSMTIPVAREIKDVPIVFNVIYDPVGAGIAKDWKHSGNNTTGVSSQVHVSNHMAVLKKIPSVKTLAVLYSPSERNSVLTVKDLQNLQSKYGIKVIPVPLTRKEEIANVMPEVLRKSDAIFITGSNMVDAQIVTIVDMATKAKVITITFLEDLVRKGVLLGVCANPYAMGRLAGSKAVRILKGAKPSSIPIEQMKAYDFIINMSTLKAGNFDLPPQLKRNALTMK